MDWHITFIITMELSVILFDGMTHSTFRLKFPIKGFLDLFISSWISATKMCSRIKDSLSTIMSLKRQW